MSSRSRQIRSARTVRAVDEAGQDSRAEGLLQLADRLALDLPHAFPSDREHAADFFQGVGVAVRQAESHAEDLALAVVQPLHHLLDPLLQRLAIGLAQRIVPAVIFQKLAEVAVIMFADRLIQRQRLAGHLQNAAGFVQRQPHAGGGLFGRRLAAQFLDQLPRGHAHPAHRIDHVDRHPDRPALVGDRPGDRLADPPRGVGGELVAAGILELVHRPHQARIALLDQVQETQPAIAVLFGDGDHQPQIAGRQAAFGGIVLLAVGLGPDDRRPSVAGLSNVIRIRYRSSSRSSLRLRPNRDWPRSASRISAWIVFMRLEISTSFSYSGWSRLVRRFNSSTNRTQRFRRRTSEAHAARRTRSACAG